ncbi:MAG: permease-like cell division protein FtsX [Patescibacteria group bacterium]|nr:permease-like cell division protein FtsX [Patescibacteria group bacterium]MDD5534393.1 permease-like cell division protein FtsX [Patescibacteria group bacterium]
MRIIKLAFQNFFRNLPLSLTSILIMLLMLFSLSFLSIINILAQETLNSFKDKFDLSVYFKQNVDENQINLFRSELENMVEVKEVHYITPQQALEQFKSKHQDVLTQKSLEELNDNPLSSAITIKLRDPNDYNTVFNVTQKPEFNALIQDQDFYDYQQIMDAFNKFNKKIHYVGWAFSGLFVFIAILVIFNTIKLGIWAQEKEIKIMRLVGATSWFVQGPFLFEGFLYGFIAWILNALIIIPLITYAQPYIKQFFELDFSLLDYLKNNILSFGGGFLLFALIVGILASGAATKKYLKA